MQATLPTSHDTGIDIVCLSLSRWNAAISSPAVALVKEFSKKHRVFFIEHPYSYKDLLHEKNGPSFRSGNITVITPPAVMPINFLPEGKVYNFFYDRNQSILLHTLRKILKQNNIRQYLFINFFDPFFLTKIPDDIAPAVYVYQCMDDISQVDYTRRHGQRLENEIVKTADLVLCTSTQLVKLQSEYSGNVYLHPNAADFDLFHTAAGQPLPRPADMNFPGKKIIGFTGSIEYRTDFALLKKLAIEHSDKILFLVGPVMGSEHEVLLNLPNIVFAGPRTIDQLPAYLQYFDCCIIPYKCNVLTASIYPLKINEYLAAGKPVVATAFSDDICAFNKVAYIAQTHEEFIRQVGMAIGEDDEDKRQLRIGVAAENTWTRRVEAFWKILADRNDLGSSVFA